MCLDSPLYCENCKKVDTGVVWRPNKIEKCLDCGKEMIIAPPDSYTVVFGFCYGCLQTERGLATLPVTLDDENFIIGSNCPNCHTIGRMKYTRHVDPKYHKYVK